MSQGAPSEGSSSYTPPIRLWDTHSEYVPSETEARVYNVDDQAPNKESLID